MSSLTTYERNTMPANVCRWCGRDMPDDGTGRLYCRRSHAKKQQMHRRKRVEQPVARCPHPEKRAFGYRGVAFEYARRVGGARVYECPCGAYHLASKREAAVA